MLGWTLAAATVLLLARMAHVQVVAADTFATRANLTQQADGGYRYQYNPRLIAAARAIERGTIYDRKGLPLATSRHQELLPFADRYRRLGLTLPSACPDNRTRCYPLGGLAFHVLGESVNQTNWAARNTSFVEEDFDARLKGFDDRPQAVDVRNPRTGRVSTVIKRDYTELLPLVRHKREPAHRDVQRLLRRDRDVHLTLDAGLQVMAARALRRHAESVRVGRRRGCCPRFELRGTARIGKLSVAPRLRRGRPAETASTAEEVGESDTLSTIARPRAIWAVSAGIDVQARHRRRGAPG